MMRRYTVSQAGEKLGMDESEIRFLLLHFREFLSVSVTNDSVQALDDNDLQMLQRVYRLVREDGKDPVNIRRQLRNESSGTRRSGGCQGGVLAFSSGRLGTGKSSIIWNLAHALAARGSRCLIYDASLDSGGVCDLFGSKLKLDDSQTGWEYHLASGVTVIRGEKLIQALNDADDSTQIEELQQRMIQLDAATDYVLLDCGHGRPDNTLRFAMVADQIVEVTTPDVGANADSFSVIRMLHDVDPDVNVSLIINRAASLGEAREAFARLNGAALKVSIGELSSFGWIAEDDDISQSTSRCETIMETVANSPGARCIGRLADTLTNRLTPLKKHSGNVVVRLTDTLNQSIIRRNSSLPDNTDLVETLTSQEIKKHA